MNRRVSIVTGATAGIGRALAQVLACAGDIVVCTGRDVPRGAATQAELRRVSNNDDVDFVPLDLESLRGTRAFAAVVRERFARVDVIVHNAGVVYRSRRLTEDGFEAQLQVVHLAPFLLTHALVPVLGAGSRVVNVVSDLHKKATRLDDYNSERGFGPLPLAGSVRAYARAEFFKVCATFGWAQRLGPRLIHVNCVHPGGVRTKIMRDFRGPLAGLLWLSDLLKKSPARAGRDIAAVSTEAVGNVTGQYFAGVTARLSSKRSRDPQCIERVWRTTAEHLGIYDDVWAP